jgi:radical SAM protein with 4Fe4S-binding SPASM domain
MKVVPMYQAPVNIPSEAAAVPFVFSRRSAKIAANARRTKDGTLGAPLSLQVALTDACFNRCIMCDHPSRPIKMIGAKTWLDTLNGISKIGALESVCYSGGDPMAYQEFNQVMALHESLGIAFGATISGVVPKFIDTGLLAKAAWIRVSLDAITPDVYTAVRGHIDISHVIDGIDKMLAASVHVGLGITLHKMNEPDLVNVLAFAESRGITDIDVRTVYPGSMAQEPPADRNIQKFNRCHASLYQLYIDASGDVYPCCITAGDTLGAPQSYALGNIKDSWPVIWHEVIAYSRLTINQLPPICRSCCVQRLSEINMVCDAVESMGKLFF